MYNEESVKSFGDALWYCFAVVTTIGFGDITAVTNIGRILTVILSFYGIIVVAIFTSVIVNFYNEVKDRPDERESDNRDAEPSAACEAPPADPEETANADEE